MTDPAPQGRSFRIPARRRPLVLAALWLLSGLYIVRPDEQAVVRLFGRVVAGRVHPGLHWQPPWPIARADRARVNEARRVSVGFDLADEATGKQTDPRVGQFVTGDQNIVNIQLVIQYCIDDPVQYLTGAQNPDEVIAAAAGAAITREIQGHSVDYVLTEGRAELQETVRKQTTRLLKPYGVGLRLVSSSIKAAFPPSEVSDAFKAVASARGDRDRIIDEARGYRNEVVERACGEAVAMARQAEAESGRFVAEAEGDAERFTKVLGEYAKARDVTRTRLYIETMEQIVPRMNVIVSDSSGGRRPLDLGMIRSVLSPGSGPAETP